MLFYGPTLLLDLALGFRANKLSPGWDHLLWAPLVAACCDMIENLFHDYAIMEYRDHQTVSILGPIGSVFSFAKFTLLMSSLLCCEALAVRWACVVAGCCHQGDEEEEAPPEQSALACGCAEEREADVETGPLQKLR